MAKSCRGRRRLRRVVAAASAVDDGNVAFAESLSTISRKLPSRIVASTVGRTRPDKKSSAFCSSW